MKYAKMLGLLAVAATAFMAFAATASATQATAPSGTFYTSQIEAVNEGTVTLKGVATVNCTASTVQGSVSSHGASVTAIGPVSTLTFSGCDQHVVVKAKGVLEGHGVSGGSGTLTSSGATVTVEFTTIFGSIHCNFESKNSDVAVLTGAPSPTGHATLHIGNNAIPVEAVSAFLCGSSIEWKGAYKVVAPTGLLLD